MTREVLSFTAGLGHAEVIFRCDNEPTMRQLLKYVVSTRLSMGLATRSVTPPAYSHGNSLVENVIGRLRPLASILMHSVRKRTGIDFSTNPRSLDVGTQACSLVDEQIWCCAQCDTI